MRSRTVSATSFLVAATIVTALALSKPVRFAAARDRAPAAKLTLEHIGSDSSAFDVIATIVMGPKEALLWDTQYHLADARRLADRIAASGRKLKAIVLSHPDHDHFSGAAVIVERFPGTPVYMTAKALEEYRRTAAQAFRGEKSRSPELLPDSIVTPQPLPSMQLTVDGEKVEIIPDVVGDVGTGTNSMLWIPSLRTVLASDVVFDNVHPWLGATDETARVAWHASIKRIAELKPQFVVAGHKKDVAAPNSPAVLTVMDRYLTDFDSLRKTTAGPQALYQAMMQRYPDHAVSTLLRFAAMGAFAKLGDQVRTELTAVNKAWGAARMAYDSSAYERMLAPDFYVTMGGQRVTRQAFIQQVSQRPPGGKLVRFDNPIISLTKDPAKDEWIAVVLEKLELERAAADGSAPAKMYSVWVTRDTYRRSGSGWQIVSSEAIGSENWMGRTPPIPNW
ncbi:MAG TPA: MBL fold metallo-hydrolase [Gemmatimonadaceae bacterium]|nr:MBL fold metallo-hydrolase [Gemmatimonadaceae bacterium]